jgi:hypothetical protein
MLGINYHVQSTTNTYRWFRSYILKKILRMLDNRDRRILEARPPPPRPAPPPGAVSASSPRGIHRPQCGPADALRRHGRRVCALDSRDSAGAAAGVALLLQAAGRHRGIGARLLLSSATRCSSCSPAVLPDFPQAWRRHRLTEARIWRRGDCGDIVKPPR